QTFVGTPPPYDMDGANDLCFDPRDSNILYVAFQSIHWIGKLNISAGTMSLYAGVPGPGSGAGGGFVNGPAASARFNQPSSLIMADGSVSGYPIGTLFIADHANSAIRMIDPTGTTVSSLCGQGVGPAPTDGPTFASLGPSYAVSGSITWVNGP